MKNKIFCSVLVLLLLTTYMPLVAVAQTESSSIKHFNFIQIKSPRSKFSTELKSFLSIPPSATSREKDLGNAIATCPTHDPFSSYNQFDENAVNLDFGKLKLPNVSKHSKLLNEWVKKDVLPFGLKKTMSLEEIRNTAKKIRNATTSLDTYNNFLKFEIHRTYTSISYCADPINSNTLHVYRAFVENNTGNKDLLIEYRNKIPLVYDYILEGKCSSGFGDDQYTEIYQFISEPSKQLDADNIDRTYDGSILRKITDDWLYKPQTNNCDSEKDYPGKQADFVEYFDRNGYLERVNDAIAEFKDGQYASTVTRTDTYYNTENSRTYPVYRIKTKEITNPDATIQSRIQYNKNTETQIPVAKIESAYNKGKRIFITFNIPSSLSLNNVKIVALIDSDYIEGGEEEINLVPKKTSAKDIYIAELGQTKIHPKTGAPIFIDGGTLYNTGKLFDYRVYVYTNNVETSFMDVFLPFGEEGLSINLKQNILYTIKQVVSNLGSVLSGLLKTVGN